MTRSEHLHTQMMALVRGERANDVADALIRSIAATVIVATETPDQADLAIQEISERIFVYAKIFWEAKDEIDAAIRKENTASGGGTDVVQ